MAENIDFNKIAEAGVEEAAAELKKEYDEGAIDRAMKLIDNVTIVANATKGVAESVGMDEGKLKEIAKESAKAAIKETLKRLK